VLEAAQPSMAASNGTLQVLLVEDSPLLATRLAEMIRLLPEVSLLDTVQTEREALEGIAARTPDVVVLDLKLRSGTGFGVLRSLAGAAHRPQVIVLTNHGLPEYRREAEHLGAEAFLDKSRDYFRLPSLLRALSQRRAAPSRPPAA